MNRYNRSDKVCELTAVPLVSKRLLDQVRERIRYLHYSLRTEKAYVYWTRFFVRWAGANGGMRHPRELGSAEVEAFLTMLANERQVSPATHRQALNGVTDRNGSRGPVHTRWKPPFPEVSQVSSRQVTGSSGRPVSCGTDR